MSTATVILWALALILWVLAWRRGDGSHVRGPREGGQILMRTLPLMLVAFVIVGYVEVLAPQELVQQWIGPESGWRGVLVATLVGPLLPGGPYVTFPLIAALYRAGAGLGPVVAMTTAWAMLGLISVGFELSFLGWRFTVVRWGLGLPMPLLVGALVWWVLG